MKMPNFEKAVVPMEKLTEYLLSDSHPVGFSKAVFFRKAGYTRENAAELRDELLRIATGEVSEISYRERGMKYVILGKLKGIVKIKTVWTIDNGAEIPRFVTAYPDRERT